MLLYYSYAITESTYLLNIELQKLPFIAIRPQQLYSQDRDIWTLDKLEIHKSHYPLLVFAYYSPLKVCHINIVVNYVNVSTGKDEKNKTKENERSYMKIND